MLRLGLVPLRGHQKLVYSYTLILLRVYQNPPTEFLTVFSFIFDPAQEHDTLGANFGEKVFKDVANPPITAILL